MDDKRIEKINKIRFSFSGLSTFHGCKHSYLLTYLTDGVERTGNFFSDYGLLVHDVLERFFRGELELIEMADYFSDNYTKFVTHLPPGFIKEKPYIEQGRAFFETFDFDRDAYEVLIIEDKIDVDLLSYKLVVKPDLVLKHKETGKIFLMDYKTSIIEKNGKVDEKKLDGYKRQMYMYALYLQTKKIKIDEVWLWFIRQESNKLLKFKILKSGLSSIATWISKTVDEIKVEEDFAPDVQPFFCKNLCSVSSYCEHKPEQENKNV